MMWLCQEPGFSSAVAWRASSPLSPSCPRVGGIWCSSQNILGVFTLRFLVPAAQWGWLCRGDNCASPAYWSPNPERVKIRLNTLRVVIFTKSDCGLWIVNYSFQVTEAYFIHSYLGIICFARPYHTLIQILL